jgi:hypothetical protein
MTMSAVAIAVLVALVGWFATIRVISNSALSSPRKRLLLVVSWIPWISLALGAPIFNGLLPLSEAVNIGGAMTVVITRRQPPRR